MNANSQHILLIEDNEDHRILIERHLQHAKEEFVITHVGSLEEARDVLSKEAFLAILLDLNLPDARGLEGLMAIFDLNVTLPIVVLTSLNDEATALDALHHGAQDYIRKDEMSPQLLSRSIRYSIERRRTEDALYESNDKLRRSNEALEQFAYVVSHDLKAPLRGIKQLAIWIEEDAGDVLSGNVKSYLNKMQGRVSRMETMISDILTYSRIGQENMEAEVVNPETLIQDILALLSIPEYIAIHVEGDVSEMKLAKTPFKLVVRNLIDNAIKHHDKENGTIWITLTMKGAAIEIEVKDDGPGIDPEHHERIFKMFTMLKPKDVVEGSGMGLAMVKKTLDHYKGTIHLDSEEGKGTSFRVTWPAAK